MCAFLSLLGLSGGGRRFWLAECGSCLASSAFRHLAGGRIFSSLPGDEVPSEAEQDCTCPFGVSSGVDCLSAVLSPSAGGLGGRHFQPAKSSSRAAVSFHSHAGELRPTAYSIQRGVRGRARSPTPVTNVTNMSAGGFRS